ncbi:MAG: universal stress protein [Caulobacteraceae bacterium]|nr:universal stress protein [Caulobacteraceae bacterium]
MTYAAVIAHVQADPQAAPRLKCAVEVARRFNAAIIGVGAESVPPLAFDGGYYSMQADWFLAMRETIEKRLKAAGATFREATESFGDRAIFLEGLELPTPAMAAASRAADLIIAGGASRGTRDIYSACDTAELAILSGRPVLVAPSRAPALEAKRVLVAWKDTREARRALTDATPFLEMAEQVKVIAISSVADAPAAQAQVDDVAAALNRRGAHATAEVVHDAHPSGFQVLRQASLAGADLIVAGAYGHSRLGEWVFGGMTADLLSQDEVYVLISH